MGDHNFDNHPCNCKEVQVEVSFINTTDSESLRFVNDGPAGVF